jgi:uncharacterized protein
MSGLLLPPTIWADQIDEEIVQSEQQYSVPVPKSRPKPKPAAHRMDPAEQVRLQMRLQANKGLVGIVSEGTDDTTDMAIALAADQGGVRLLPIAGAGAAQNVKDVLLTRGIDFGIIQMDVLDEIKSKPPFPGVENYLRYITKLYDQQVHVLAGPDFHWIEDLKGRKVNFGRRDSGTFITATNIFNAHGFQPDVTTLPHQVALDQLRRGEIAAMVYVATKPARMFRVIRPDENLHFIQIGGNLPDAYTPVTIYNDDYPELVSKETPVNTVELGTVLVAYNWPGKSDRSQRVTRFVQAFFTHLNDIQAAHPKWQKFDVTSTVPGWTRYPGAEQWLKKAGLPLDQKKREALFQDFEAYQKEALFRDFEAYQKRVQVAFRGITTQH